MPVWLFSSGPFGAVEEHPTAPMPPVAERLAAQLGARENVMFGGRVPTDPGNFVERAMLKNTPPERRDARDWPAIEEWARGVASQVAAARARAGGLTRSRSLRQPDGVHRRPALAGHAGKAAQLLGQQVRGAAQRARGAQPSSSPKAR